MILEAKGVRKSFGGVKAVDGCGFSVESGRITAIIGPNGSGKSTMFNVISRLLKEDEGEIWFRGRDCRGLKSFEMARLGISRTFQETRLFGNLTIGQHLEIALSNSDEKLIKSVLTKEESRDERIGEILGTIGLDKPESAYADDLSYGQRKLLDLGVAVAVPHGLLMLDEPVAGVNPGLRGKIREILAELNRKKKETVLLIEHDMNFVMSLADRVIVMSEGKVIAEGKPEEIQGNEKVLRTYLGE